MSDELPPPNNRVADLEKVVSNLRRDLQIAHQALRSANDDAAKLRSALELLCGVSTREELEAMLKVMAALPQCDANTAATAGVKALLETLHTEIDCHEND